MTEDYIYIQLYINMHIKPITKKDRFHYHQFTFMTYLDVIKPGH